MSTTEDITPRMPSKPTLQSPPPIRWFAEGKQLPDAPAASFPFGVPGKASLPTSVGDDTHSKREEPMTLSTPKFAGELSLESSVARGAKVPPVPISSSTFSGHSDLQTQRSAQSMFLFGNSATSDASIVSFSDPIAACHS
jgi:hypothetical protein